MNGEPTTRTGPPWEQPGDAVNRFITTMRGVLLDPNTVFATMRREGGLGPPLAYGVIGLAIGLVIGFALQIGFSMMPGIPFNQPGLGGTAALVMYMVASPVIAVCALFLSSAVYHLMLMVLGAARFPFETTFRVTCYAAGSTGPINAVPFCGGLIATVWNIVVMIIGLSRAQEISGGTAAAAVLVPMALCCALIVLFFGALTALFFGAAAGASLTR